MFLGLIGRKIGMFRLYVKSNKSIAITLLKIFDSYIVKKINYFYKNCNSFQIVYNINFNKNKYNKSLTGYFFKNNFKFFGSLKEFYVNDYYISKFNIYSYLPLNLFYINQYIKVTSRSIGKGYSGVIKRHKFKSSPATHGNSKSHNKPGSIGMNQDPGRVFLGKKMSGRLGNKFVTISGLKIKKINFRYKIFYIDGSIPGCKNSIVFISPNF